MMSSFSGRVLRGVRVAGFILVLALFLAAGCESQQDYLDHVPPSGKGSLIIDNWAASDVIVYVDGTNTMQVGGTSSGIVDMNPGTYRIVLSEDGGNRNYRDYVDVLVSNLTVLKVRVISGNTSSYSVTTEFHPK